MDNMLKLVKFLADNNVHLEAKYVNGVMISALCRDNVYCAFDISDEANFSMGDILTLFLEPAIAAINNTPTLR